MKKVISVFFVAGLLSIVACGPSAEDKAKQDAAEKAKMDSLFNAASQSISTSMDTIPAHDSTHVHSEEEHSH